MATNILLVGIATDGPANETLEFNSISELTRTFGGYHVERSFLSATASALTLGFTPIGAVTPSWNNKKVLYNPYVEDNTLYFGQVGGSGLWVDVAYSPYLGMSDVVAAGRFCLENGATSVKVCRISGTKAALNTEEGWVFESAFRGSRYNDVLVTASSGRIAFSGLEPNYGSRVFTGTPDRMAAQINQEARIGACPVYVKNYSETFSVVTALLSGGTDGNVTPSALGDFLDTGNIPNNTSHVAVLAPINETYMSTVLDHLDEEYVQPRLFLFNSPSTLTPLSIIGSTTAENVLNTYFGSVSKDIFSSYTNTQTVTGTLGLSISSTATPPIFYTRAVSGNLNTATYSTSGALHMAPAASGLVTFTALNSKKIRGFGFWVTEGNRCVKLQGYDGVEAYTPIYGPTTLTSGTPYFISMGVERPMTHVEVSLESGSYSHFAIDDLQVKLVDSAGGNMDQVFASIRLLPERSPYVSSIYGDVDCVINNTTVRRYGVEVVAEYINRNDCLITNKPLKTSVYRPLLNADEVEIAKLNGFSPIVRKIGNGVSVYQGMTTDPETDFVFSSKASQIASIANDFLFQYIGRPLREGTQVQIAEALSNKLKSSTTDVMINSVLVDYIDETLRVFIEGQIFDEIMKISFSTTAV